MLNLKYDVKSKEKINRII